MIYWPDYFHQNIYKRSKGYNEMPYLVLHQVLTGSSLYLLNAWLVYSFAYEAKAYTYAIQVEEKELYSHKLSK